MRIAVLLGRQPDGVFRTIHAGDCQECRRLYKSASAPPEVSELHYFDTDGSHMRKRLREAINADTAKATGRKKNKPSSQSND